MGSERDAEALTESEELIFDDYEDSEPRPPDRFLNRFTGIGNNVNSMIGVGIFTTPGIIWETVQSPGIVLLLFIFGGIISMCGSLSYVELGSMFADRGGEAIYLREAYPKPYRMVSYVFGILFITAISSAAIAAIANACAGYIVYATVDYPRDPYVVDALQPRYLDGWHFWRIRLLALAVLLLIVLYHMYSNQLANRINSTLTIIKTGTLLVVAIVGLINVGDHAENWRKLFERPKDAPPLTANAFAASMLLAMFSYNGWNNLNYTLSEFQNPRQNLKCSNPVSVGIVTVLYILAIMAYISVLPTADVVHSSSELKSPSDSIAGQFAYQLNGGHAGRALAVFICFSALGTMAVLTMAASRVIVAGARMNYIPLISGWLKMFHKRGTPVNALLFLFIWIGCIIMFAPSQRPFAFLASVSQYCSWLAYGLTGIGLLVMRKTQTDKYRPFKVWLPVPIIFSVFSIFLWIGCWLNGGKALDSSFVYSPYLTSVILVILILLSWLWWHRYNDVRLETASLEEKLSNEPGNSQNTVKTLNVYEYLLSSQNTTNSRSNTLSTQQSDFSHQPGSQLTSTFNPSVYRNYSITSQSNKYEHSNATSSASSTYITPPQSIEMSVLQNN